MEDINANVAKLLQQSQTVVCSILRTNSQILVDPNSVFSIGCTYTFQCCCIGLDVDCQCSAGYVNTAASYYTITASNKSSSIDAILTTIVSSVD